MTAPDRSCDLRDIRHAGRMSSLAPLSLAAAPAAPAFNVDFYVTTATVIPVLFLALALQSSTYENLLKAFSAMAHASDALEPRWPGASPRYQEVAAGIAAATLAIIAILLLFVAVVSEVLAVYALYQRQAQSTTGGVVLFGAILMVIATAAGPALTLLRVLAINMGSVSPAPDEPTGSGSSGEQQLPAVAKDVNSSESPEPDAGTADPSTRETGKLVAATQADISLDYHNHWRNSLRLIRRSMHRIPFQRKVRKSSEPDA
jgi:uncharacterized membrane protein